jgi:uncharacterized cupin superfamily protein
MLRFFSYHVVSSTPLNTITFNPNHKNGSYSMKRNRGIEPAMWNNTALPKGSF